MIHQTTATPAQAATHWPAFSISPIAHFVPGEGALLPSDVRMPNDWRRFHPRKLHRGHSAFMRDGIAGCPGDPGASGLLSPEIAATNPP